MTDVTRYPLSWPHGWPRAPQRQNARFSSRGGSYQNGGNWHIAVTISDGLDRLNDELKRLGARDVLISTNLVVGQRGMPLANQAEPRDPGVAVYFKLKGKDRVLACDSWRRTAENLAAIAAHIDAIRRQERYKVGTLDQAFAGYDALPPPGADNRPPWRKVFGFTSPGTIAIEQVEVRYRHLAKQFHPDMQNGSHDAMAQLNQAREAAYKELSA